MQFDLLTIFPDIFQSFLNESLLAKARQRKIVKINIHNIRDYTLDRHQKVDDSPYGGGPGMIMQAEPIYRCLKSIKKVASSATRRFASPKRKRGERGEKKRSLVVILDPRGEQFTQAKALKYSQLSQLILICGRYEGIDERIKKFVDESLSIGPYILNGGEVAALAVIEATSRLVKGFVGRPESLKEETFSLKTGKFEYPQYTRPEILKIGKKKLVVPKILLSGDHQKIKDWREKNKK